MLNVHHRENVRMAIAALTLCWVTLAGVFIYNTYAFVTLVGLSQFFWHLMVIGGGYLILGSIVVIRANIDQLEQIQAMVDHREETVPRVPELVKV
jgi:hypothetical protein